MKGSVGFYVQRLHRAMRASFDAGSRRSASAPEWTVLALCGQGPQTPAALAADMAVARAMVSRLVDRLEQVGLVEAGRTSPISARMSSRSRSGAGPSCRIWKPPRGR